MKKILFLCGFLAACSNAPKVNPSDTYHQRMESVSAQFIGTKYIFGALGEGQGYDANPVLRTDGFDCVTYVETVMAYGRDGDVLQNKIEISYLDAKLDYVHRKHFWELDQAESDTMTDITAKLGAPVKILPTTIDKKEWFSRKKPPVETDFKPVRLNFSYIPKDKIDKIDSTKLPQISIIGIVAYDADYHKRIGTDNPNRHVGFVIKKPSGDLVVRHASQSQMKVVEETWEEFTSHQMGLKNRIGIKIWSINE